MRSTPVKDVGSIFTNPMPAAGNKTFGIGQAGFQNVLNNQTQKNLDNRTANRTSGESNGAKKPAEKYSANESKPVENTSQTKPENAGDTKDTGKAETNEAKDVSMENAGEEMTPEEMEAAMAVLETAAAELIQKIAGLLEIPVEEVQSFMEGLGMDQLDVLDQAQLGKLFLQAAGMEDPYALVTDEKLYGDYQELMKQLDVTLQECGGQLGTDAAQFQNLLAGLREQSMAQRETPLVEVSQEEGSPESKAADLSEGGLSDLTEADGQKENVTRDKEHGQRESGSEQKEQGSNVFIQNLRTEAFRPEVQRTAEFTGMAETDTENIMRQIMDYMKIQVKADTSNLEMQLHPASLGTVQVQIASKGGAVTANFIAQNETVKAALESQMVQLIERFDEQGVKVEAIEVTVQTHEFERNLDQGRGREQQSGDSGKKGRTRRINLNDTLPIDEMAEEDVLAADIMAASGNTVDYTA